MPDNDEQYLEALDRQMAELIAAREEAMRSADHYVERGDMVNGMHWAGTAQQCTERMDLVLDARARVQARTQEGGASDAPVHTGG